MDIDEYYQALEALSNQYSLANKATHDFLEELIIGTRSTIDDLISFRRSFLGSKETEEVTAYLSIGFFTTYTGIERTTCFVICFELDEIAIKKSWRMRCEGYTHQHPLFTAVPGLLEYIHNDELIDFSVLKQINGSEILQVNKHYTLIDAALNPMIATWTKETFSRERIYIRVNPFQVYNYQPPQRLFESVLMPANPNWWKNLTIHNRAKEGASYVLDDCMPDEDPLKYWELHIKRIKRLEVIAKRTNSGNLSMMIEEITDIDKNGLLFGRCIHLDTDAPFGTAFEDSLLNHLDLAVNIYEGETAKKRLLDNLAQGQVTTDASYRTHLLKIEKIPFKALFAFVTSFLRSKTLVNEWFQDQFKEDDI